MDLSSIVMDCENVGDVVFLDLHLVLGVTDTSHIYPRNNLNKQIQIILRKSNFAKTSLEDHDAAAILCIVKDCSILT